MRHGVSRLTAFLCVGLAVAVATETIGWAADPPEVLIRKGLEERKQGRTKEALPLFREAYEVSHSPRSAAQLGFCEQALGQWIEADLHLSEAGAATSDPWVARNRSVIDESLTRVRENLALVRVTGEPSGAAVTVNGQLAGRLPVPQEVRVLPGPATIDVRAPNFETLRDQPTLTAGQVYALRVQLRPQSAAPPRATDAPSTRDMVSPTSPAAAVAEASTSSDAHGRSSTWTRVGWIAAGAGLAAVATGGGFQVLAHQKADDARSAPVYDMKTEDASKRAQSVGNALLIGGSAALVTGVVMLLWDRMNGSSQGVPSERRLAQEGAR